jgi:hypothetical protein
MPKSHVLYPPANANDRAKNRPKRPSRTPGTTKRGSKASGKTPRRAGSPVRMRPLYLELLVLLFAVGYLRTDQVVRGLAVLAAQLGESLPQKALLRVVQKWLLSAVQTGILRRIVPPVVPHERKGPPTYIYCLAKDGAALVAEHQGVSLAELDWRPGRDESQLFLNHTLQTVELRILLMQACLAAQIELDFVDERFLKRAPAKVTVVGDNGEALTVTVIPDGFFRLRLPNGKQLVCCLETDMASTTIASTKWQARSFRRKVLGYQALVASEHAGDVWNAQGAVVLTVTTTATRRAHLQQACEDAVDDPHWVGNFWFSTFEELRGADKMLSAPLWWVAGKGEKRFCLVPPR